MLESQPMHRRSCTTLLLLLAAASSAVTFASCRGEVSNKPPIHLVPNMDWQPKFKAQSTSKFAGWKDGRGMRHPVRGTIARGQLRELNPDPEVAKLYVYKNGEEFVKTNPLPKTREVIARGKERFTIHCSVCHGANARGMGIVGRKLPVKPPSLVKEASDDHPLTRNADASRVLVMTDGEMFGVITEGKGGMRPYKYQVSVEDRWAIIHYLRVLQLRAASN